MSLKKSFICSKAHLAKATRLLQSSSFSNEPLVGEYALNLEFFNAILTEEYLTIYKLPSRLIACQDFFQPLQQSLHGQQLGSFLIFVANKNPFPWTVCYISRCISCQELWHFSRIFFCILLRLPSLKYQRTHSDFSIFSP